MSGSDDLDDELFPAPTDDAEIEPVPRSTLAGRGKGGQLNIESEAPSAITGTFAHPLGPVAAWPPNTPYGEHPLSALFPIMEGDAFAALGDDIRRKGVREPIVLFEGKVLDGRNRYLAARQALLPYDEIPTVQYEGPDPLAYVVSLNLRRRHLNESQRALIAAKLAERSASASGEHESANLHNPPTTARAAALLNVSPRSVASARTVARDGVPRLLEAVAAGEISVAAAAMVVRLSEDEQAALVDEGPGAVRAAAAEVRSGRATGSLSGGQARRRQDGLTVVARACRKIADTIGEQGAASMIASASDDGTRERCLEAIRAGHAALTRFLDGCAVGSADSPALAAAKATARALGLICDGA